jgi:hypothetical protein
MDDSKRKYWGLDNMYIATALSYCYLTTGDAKYLAVIRKTYVRCLELAEGRSDGPASPPTPQKFDWTVGGSTNFENFWATLCVLEQAKKEK